MDAMTTAISLHHGDALATLKRMPDASVDAIVTDPPYELGFMGKAWDGQGIANSVDLWTEALRVLKPGGHLVSFGGTRTYHRMACAIEDAGFEIRDSLAWLYGSGFPKSHNVSKAIDKAAGAEREAIGTYEVGGTAAHGKRRGRAAADSDEGAAAGKKATLTITAPATPEVERWEGWGTALKPSHEPIVLARKPFKGTVAANVLEHGTGALNIDGCRVPTGGEARASGGARGGANSYGGFGGGHPRPSTAGRWPPNTLLSHSAECNGVCAPDCPVAVIGEQSGERASPATYVRSVKAEGEWLHAKEGGTLQPGHADTGTAARFYPNLTPDPLTGDPGLRYIAKASRAERNAGLGGDRCTHPTVKPLALCRWLCRLITPPGGRILDPFMGSGSTGCAAMLEGFDFVGIDAEAEYVDLARRRIAYWRDEATDAERAKTVPAAGAESGRDWREVLGERGGSSFSGDLYGAPSKSYTAATNGHGEPVPDGQLPLIEGALAWTR